MPGSLLEVGTPVAHKVVRRANSSRSDKSDCSACVSEGGSKKVSFNKAVRVKKYSTPPQHTPVDISENKFWFRVFSNSSSSAAEAKQSPSPVNEKEENPTGARPLSIIVESDSPTSSPPPEMPKTNGHSAIERSSRRRSPIRSASDDVHHYYCSSAIDQKSANRRPQRTPFEPEVDYVTESKRASDYSSTKKDSAKNQRFVNGVKVMFGMSPKSSRKVIQTKSERSVAQDRTDEIDHRSRKALYEMSQNGTHSDNVSPKNKEFHLHDSRISKNAGKYERIVDRSKVSKDQKSYPVSNYENASQIERKEDEKEEQQHSLNHIIPVEIWDSGPILVSDYHNAAKSSFYEPGEGKALITREEGLRVWKHKTRRKYEEIIPKEKKSKERRSESLDHKMIERNKRIDDDRLVSAAELDEAFLDKKEYASLGNENDFFPYLDSYLPKMEDKAIQCELKKSSRKTRESKQQVGYKVIRSGEDGSVSAFSNVPSLLRDEPNGEVIYSQVDKSKKKHIKADSEYLRNSEERDYYYERNPTTLRSTKSPVRSVASPSFSRRYANSPQNSTSQRTIETKGFGLQFDAGVDGPVVKLPPRPPTPKVNKRLPTEAAESWYLSSPSFKNSRNIKRETIEETISISNASSEDIHHPDDIDDSPKSVIREIDKEGKTISYENLTNRKSPPTNPYEGQAISGGGVWVKPVDEDYRRGMVQSEVSLPSGFTSYSTMSRIESKKKPPKAGYSPVSQRHAMTLDKHYLQERKNKKINGIENIRNHSIVSDQSNKYKDQCNGRSAHSMRKFNSSRDLSADSIECRRGGLAAAYKARQTRHSSLNRIGNTSINGSMTRLNRGYGMSSSASDAGLWHSRTNLYDNDPVVLYIPAVNHGGRKDDDDRLSGIQLARTQSILSKKSSKSSKKLEKKNDAELINQSNEYVTRNPSGFEDADEIVELRDENDEKRYKKSKKELKRTHSMPKDGKVPWLQKLKLKVKSKDP